jgi:hypothetical protein
MHLEPVTPPLCPVCEEPGQRNKWLPEQVGPWECSGGCAVYFDGTTSEWDRYASWRTRRKQMREETADGK